MLRCRDSDRGIDYIRVEVVRLARNGEEGLGRVGERERARRGERPAGHNRQVDETGVSRVLALFAVAAIATVAGGLMGWMRAGELYGRWGARTSLAVEAEEGERSRRRRSAGDRRQLQALIAVLRDPVLVTDAAGVVGEGNAAAASLFGGTEAVRGRAISDLLPFLPPPDQADDGPWYGAITNAAGQTLDLAVTRAKPPGDQRGSGRVFIVHDVSRHTALSRLREQLLHDVAHELRTPLSVLDLMLAGLTERFAEMSAEEYSEMLRKGRASSRRLRDLTDNMLSAASIQSGHFVVSPQPVTAGEIVQEASDATELVLDGRGQSIAFHVKQSDITVLADRAFIAQVLTNLLDNASKYGPAGSTIGLQVAAEGESARFEVSDRGPGIPTEQQVGLFERFYRSRPRGATPGVGLGLGIAKGIVEAHGGTIGVHSAPGEGTRVWFTLPRARSDGSG